MTGVKQVPPSGHAVLSHPPLAHVSDFPASLLSCCARAVSPSHHYLLIAPACELPSVSNKQGPSVIASAPSGAQVTAPTCQVSLHRARHCATPSGCTMSIKDTRVRRRAVGAHGQDGSGQGHSESNPACSAPALKAGLHCCDISPSLLSSSPTPRLGTMLGTASPQLFAKAEMEAWSQQAPWIPTSLSDLPSKSTDFT